MTGKPSKRKEEGLAYAFPPWLCFAALVSFHAGALFSAAGSALPSNVFFYRVCPAMLCIRRQEGRGALESGSHEIVLNPGTPG